MRNVFSGSELKLALRLMLRQPLLAITIVLALGVGIGLATAGFSFMDAALNGQLPFDRGDSFVRVRAFAEGDGAPAAVTQDRLRAMRERSMSFEYLGVIAGEAVNILHPTGEVETVTGARLTPGWLSYLPYRPLAGRMLTVEDGRIGALPVTLISERLWRRRYGGSTRALGSTIDVAGTERTIVGVVPGEMEFPNSPDLWIPLPESRPLDPLVGGVPGGRVSGVLREDVDLAGARVELAGLTSAFNASAPVEPPLRVEVISFTDLSGLGIDAVLQLSVGVLVLVMLLVAVNVANLIYARATARHSDLAVRSALGASRTRLISQLFVEVLVLGTFAAVLGVVGSRQILAVVERTIDELPFWIHFDLDLKTTAFVTLSTLIAAAVGGALPGFRLTRRSLSRHLHASGRSGGRGGLGRGGKLVIVAEMALSVALVSGAGVLAWAVADANRERGSFPRGTVLAANVSVELPGEASGEVVADSATRIREEIRSRIAELPGVREVGASSSLSGLHPLPERTLIEGVEGASVREARASAIAIEAEALEILRARPLAGRLFDRRDFEEGAEPVALVNEVFARSYFGGSDALGRRIGVAPQGDSSEAEPEWHTIVGITPDLGLIRGGDREGAGYFVPMRERGFFAIAVEADSDPLSLIQPIRRAVFDVDADVVPNSFSLLENADQADRASMVAIGFVFSCIGFAALALSLVGMFAIMSFSVASRTREIGIRMALGARDLQIVKSIVGGSALVLGVGAVLGSAGAMGLNALMRAALVYEVPSAGLWLIPAIVLMMLVSGLAASWIPARRALRVRPVEAISEA